MHTLRKSANDFYEINQHYHNYQISLASHAITTNTMSQQTSPQNQMASLTKKSGTNTALVAKPSKTNGSPTSSKKDHPIHKKKHLQLLGSVSGGGDDLIDNYLTK